MRYVHLKKSDAAWHALRKARFLSTPLLGQDLLAKVLPRGHLSPQRSSGFSFHGGIIVQKKIGNAVLRNRIKRRMREAFRQAVACPTLHHSQEPSPGHSIDCVVFIRHKNIAERNFSSLVHGIQWFLRPKVRQGHHSPSLSPQGTAS